MIYVFDIDGTICTNTYGDYLNAVPYPSVIAEINRLYAAGHRIMLATARGFTTGIDWRAKRWSGASAESCQRMPGNVLDVNAFWPGAASTSTRCVMHWRMPGTTLSFPPFPFAPLVA